MSVMTVNAEQMDALKHKLVDIRTYIHARAGREPCILEEKLSEAQEILNRAIFDNNSEVGG